MRIQFLKPASLQTPRGSKAFDVGDELDVPENIALELQAQGRVRLPEREFKPFEPVLARRVSPINFRGPEYKKPQWVRGVILEIDAFRQQAKIVSDGEEFWASLAQLRKR